MAGALDRRRELTLMTGALGLVSLARAAAHACSPWKSLATGLAGDFADSVSELLCNKES